PSPGGPEPARSSRWPAVPSSPGKGGPNWRSPGSTPWPSTPTRTPPKTPDYPPPCCRGSGGTSRQACCRRQRNLAPSYCLIPPWLFPLGDRLHALYQAVPHALGVVGGPGSGVVVLGEGELRG